jgi:hypothetical protein
MSTRTNKQNNSLHLAFRKYVKQLNDSGQTLSFCIQEGLIHHEVEWTESSFKERIVRPYLEALWPDRDPRTSKLSTKEAQILFENLNNGMGKVFGISIEFPSRGE